MKKIIILILAVLAIAAVSFFVTNSKTEQTAETPAVTTEQEVQPSAEAIEVTPETAATEVAPDATTEVAPEAAPAVTTEQNNVQETN